MMENNDVVISSRIRLARNCVDFLFAPRLDDDGALEMVSTCRENIINSIDDKGLGSLQYFDSAEINALDRACFVEKHLISPEFALKYQAAGLMVNQDETISIMINEEDHLRIQTIFPGLQLSKGWEVCNKIDDAIEAKLKYAYSPEFGYLTCCPTNVGTGLRASVMIHLPSLSMTGYLNNVIDTVTKIGITVRGIYGEGSEFTGNMYQISNQVTLGQSEEEIIAKVENVAFRIIEQERIAGDKLLKKGTELEDRIFRAYGIFTNARIMSSGECMKLLSDIRLGIYSGMIKDITIDKINQLTVLTQPANLQKHFNANLTPYERDVKRAELIRRYIYV
jgi:protein arginine kinase